MDILVLKNNMVKYLIEIQNNISPKTIIGIVTATNLCTCHIDIDEKKKSIKDAILFIVVPDEIISKTGSKEEQLEFIRKNLPVDDGSLKGWFYCSEKKFKDAFEKREKVDNLLSFP